MKRALKIILFSFLSVIGVFALVIGGMYLFGGFNEKVVFAEEMHFSRAEVISSSSFELDLISTTPDVTRRDVRIEVSSGGDNIIYYSKTAKIGQRIQIAPKRDSSGKIIGGYVRLTARYADSDSTSTATATCNILIDVPVTEVSIKDTSSRQYEEEILLASAGDRLTNFLNVYPTGALKPYSSMTVINNAGMTTLKNKKVYLEVTYRDEPNSNYATLKCGGETSTLVELPYVYDSSINDFVISSNLYLLPTSPILSLGINCYVVPTIEMMNEAEITLNNVPSMGLTSSTQSVFVKNYSVDSMSFDREDKDIFFEENLNIYINNDDADENSINLNFSLNNNSGITIDDDLLKNYLRVSIVDGSEKQLPLVIGSAPKNEWYFAYTYSEFSTYYNYIQNPTDSNKLRVNLVYDDGESRIEDFFYLVPAIHNAEGLSVSHNVYSLKNGDTLSMEDKVSIVAGQHTPISSEIGYFILQNGGNAVSTMPIRQDDYMVTFDFTMPTTDKVSSLSIYPGSTWASLKDTSIVMTQNGEVVFRGDVGATGSVTTSDVKDIEAGIPVNVTITRVHIDNAVSGVVSLFRITTSQGANITISSRMTKFYLISSGNPAPTPYLSVSNVEYDSDFDYFTINGDNYIYLKESSDATLKLSGVGSFTITAMLLYNDDGVMYFLSRSITFRVDVEEVLDGSSIMIYDGEGERMFSSSTVSFEEDLESDFYLYITSSKMLAFVPAVQNGDVRISFGQDFGLSDEDLKSSPSLAEYLADDIDGTRLASIKEQLKNINKNAITFSDTWTPVYDTGMTQIVGYKVKYNINQVYTISLDGADLPSSFIVSLTATTDLGEVLGNFKITGSDATVIRFDIADKVIDTISFTYDGREVSSIDLKADVLSNGTLGWKVGDSQATDYLTSLVYGLKYKDADEVVSNPAYCSFLVEKDGSFVSLPSAYYSFDRDGYLSFSNFPYSEEGITVRMQVKVTSTGDANPLYSHYVYNSRTNTFDKRIYEELDEGKYLEFKIVSMNISVTLNEFDISGYKNNLIPLFGSGATGSVFKVTMINGSGTPVSSAIHYGDFFKTELVRIGSSSASDLTSIVDDSLSINKDFIKNENIGFKFSFDSDNVYPFLVNGDSDIYVKSIDSAFSVDLKTAYDAPSTDNVYADFIYSKTSLSAYDMAGVTLSIAPLTDNFASLYVIDNGFHTLSFKACTESYAFGVRVSITIVDEDEAVRSADFDYIDAITVTPLFNSEMIEVGRMLTDDSDPDNIVITRDTGVMVAGENNGLSMENGGIAFTGLLNDKKGEISSVQVSFSSTGLSIISSTLHMSQNSFSDVSSFGFFSYDMNKDTQVRVTFTLFFEAGGTFVASKLVNIHPNLDIAWRDKAVGEALTLQSGNSVNLTLHNNFIIYRDGSRVGAISEEYFQTDAIEGVARYSRNSFAFQNSEDEAYFTDVNAGDDSAPYILYVNYSSTQELKTIDITFKYIVDTELESEMYEIDITMSITLNVRVG